MSSQSNSPTATQDSASPSPIYIQPDIRRNRISVRVNVDDSATVELKIPELNLSHEGQPGKNVIALEEYSAWSPSEVTLYTLECTISVAEQASETISISFGMREFTVKENRFFFNNRPLYVKGFDCTGWSSEELSTDALDSLSSSGFNLIRVSPDATGEVLINHADTIGMLVEVEFGAASDLDAIATLRNHPSIVAWDLLSLDEVDLSKIHDDDPSRVIYHRDPKTNHACVLRPYHDDAQEVDFVALEHIGITNRTTSNYVSRMGNNDVLSYVRSLTIGHLALDGESATALDAEVASRELERIFANASELTAKTADLKRIALGEIIDSLRTNTRVAGYCLSSGGSADVSTLEGLAPHQGQTHVMVQLAQNNLIPRQETQVKVHFLNEDKLDGRADLSLQVVGPTNQVLWKKKRGVRLPKSGKLIWEGSIAASGSPGPHRFVVRVMQNMRRIAESSVDFFVYPKVAPWERAINLLDPRNQWKDACANLVSRIEFTAPIHIIPPISNTIRAYPDNELAQILGQVRAGSVALFFQPPSDWNEFVELIDPVLLATQRSSNQACPPTYHYAKLHPIFEELPSRCLMGATYNEITPATTFVEESDEDICGSVSHPDLDGNSLWGSNVLVKRYGSGRIVFISLPIMENLGENPIADHLFINLLKHFVRRSVPSAEGTLSVHQSSVEWIRHQRQDFTHSWAVIGMFPYSPWASQVPVYPPQDAVDLNATYPGWYEAITWKSVYATAKQDYRIDLDAELGPRFSGSATEDYGIAYAYAEIVGDTRGQMRLVPKSTVPMEVYLNGSLVYSPESDEEDPTVYVKLGKNTLLVKLYKQPGPCTFQLDLEQLKEPIKYRWWR
ncbi:MAG: hypothetical protein VCD00_07610 [Candidatus Hydrogenedentota bacterium]